MYDLLARVEAFELIRLGFAQSIEVSALLSCGPSLFFLCTLIDHRD